LGFRSYRADSERHALYVPRRAYLSGPWPIRPEAGPSIPRRAYLSRGDESIHEILCSSLLGLGAVDSSRNILIVRASSFRFVKWLLRFVKWLLVQIIKLEGLHVTFSPSSFIVCTRTSHFTNLKPDPVTMNVYHCSGHEHTTESPDLIPPGIEFKCSGVSRINEISTQLIKSVTSSPGRDQTCSKFRAFEELQSIKIKCLTG